ncbi:hypothetical protein ACW0US_18085 [Xanthomonas euvesicatoria]
MLMLTHVLAAHARAGFGIRTGDADGGDAAARAAAAAVPGCAHEVYGVSRARYPCSILLVDQHPVVQAAALQLAERHHPAWRWQKAFARQLHARNGFQVLGVGLDDPSERLICFAPKSEFDAGGKLKNVAGGTGQAVRLAYAHGIEALNLDVAAHRQRLEPYLEGFEMPESAGSEQDQQPELFRTRGP